MQEDYENEELDALQEQKQERAAKGVYIILAVIITVTMVVSVIAAVNRRRQKNDPLPEVNDTVQTEAATKAPDKTKTTKDSSKNTKPIPEITKPKSETTLALPSDTEPPAHDTEPEEPTVIERVYVVPVNGSVIKDYTMDLPVYSVTMNDYRVHNGIDLTAGAGSPVYAFCDGTIDRIYYDPMMGQTVVIDHGDGLKSVYQNLQITLPDNIEEGAKVFSGDVIGAVGETALIECAEVSHLHFSVMKDGAYAAPGDYIGSFRETFDE